MKIFDALVLGFIAGRLLIDRTGLSPQQKPQEQPAIIDEVETTEEDTSGVDQIKIYAGYLVEGQVTPVPYVERPAVSFWIPDNWANVRH